MKRKKNIGDSSAVEISFIFMKHKYNSLNFELISNELKDIAQKS